ncbi:uncharacterized protein LOC110239607 [Exaiptasia diaphana]|uniref:ShKT domain-containing protein n=1 Tax=Exaiptasia diaphana TaxID=2652724 RepID=A0A913X965_EXADI|nr:uncharacterized protein LOC110239607 [Exaiptasia diaphana]KXJ26717.1 hypothetical protein AC249_AIPGENE9261 [Exaiptasia diaphana]
MVTYGLFVVFAVLASSQAYAPGFFDNALNVGNYAPMSRNFNCGNIQHPLGCTFSPDCSVKTCKVDFVGLKFEFQLTINKCENPVTVTISFKVHPLNINFAHTFPSDQTIPIPGLENGFGPLRGGVFVMVKMRPDNGKLNVKIQLQCGIAIGNNPIFPIVLDLLKGPLPIDTSTCNGGGGGGGGGIPPPPPPPAVCEDTNPLCGFLKGQCGNPQISGMCQKTCAKC